MDQNRISELIRRFEEGFEAGKNNYFDADEFEELVDYFDSLNDIDMVKDILNLGLNIHPDNHFLLLKKIKLMVYEGLYKDSLTELDSFPSIYDYDVYLLRIECNLQLRYYDQACTLIAELLQLEQEEPKDAVFAEIGYLFVDADYYHEALEYFDLSIKHDSRNIEVLSDMSYAFEMLGDFDSAIDVTNKIIDIDPYSFDAWMSMGRLQSLKENFAEAVDAFDFGLVISPTSEEATKLKAHSLSLSNRLEDAIDIYKRLIEVNKEDSSLYLLISECYESLQLYQESLTYLYKYQNIEPDNEDLLERKIILLLKSRDVQQATDTLKDGLEKFPESEQLKKIAKTFDILNNNYL